MYRFKRLGVMSVFLLMSALVLVVSGCKGVQEAKKVSKPKPTEAGARAFEQKYWKLMDSGKYAEGYALLSPQDKKLISKELFVKKNQEKEAERKVPRPKIEINSVELKDNQAKLSLGFDTPLGKITQLDTIVFIDGKWYQKLEIDSLIFYGVSPMKIPEIKKAALNERISIPAFDAVVLKAETSKTATGEFGERKTAQGKYVVIEATITNTGKETFRFDAKDFLKLMDSEGRTFEPVTEFAVFDFFKEIGAGMNETVKVGFDVPESAGGFKLLIGTENDKYLVELGI